MTSNYKRANEPVVALAKSRSAVYEEVVFAGLLREAVELIESAGIVLGLVKLIAFS